MTVVKLRPTSVDQLLSHLDKERDEIDSMVVLVTKKDRTIDEHWTAQTLMQLTFAQARLNEAIRRELFE